MRQIDREGTFRCVPREWWVTRADSGAVAVSLDLDIIETWNGSDWDDWTQYGQYTVLGDYWVVKKDGTVNQGTVEQLARSMGWDGNLTSVQGAPPNVLVSVSVKADTYKGTTRYKAGWMNPGDQEPKGGATAEQVQDAANRFGSLLRAAAAGAAKAAKPVPAPPREERAEEPPPSGDADAPNSGTHPDSTGDDDLPFR